MSLHRRAFILQNTRLHSPPLLPELRLHLADEITPLWQMTEEEMGAMSPPFWAFAWVGGQAVARYLLDHPADAAGKRVVDFGAGSGLCAIAAMKAGAAHALAADVDPFSREAVALNARANGVSVTVSARDLLDADPPDTGLILAGDVCYEKPLAERVLNWLKRARRSGVRVLLGDPGRPYFAREGLIRLADYHVPTTRELEDRPIKQTGVFTLI
ncbi:MAG: methyltransferase [Chloroflexi bacterium]|nr:methyltransferase [Chloroflexota bacterium]